LTLKSNSSCPKLDLSSSKCMQSMEEELECLQAIYGPDELEIVDMPPCLKHLRKRIALKLPNDTSAVIVIPAAYPSVSPVIMKTTYSWMTSSVETFLKENFIDGEVVLLAVIQHLRDIAEGRREVSGETPHLSMTKEAINMAVLSSSTDIGYISGDYNVASEDSSTEQSNLLCEESNLGYGSTEGSNEHTAQNVGIFANIRGFIVDGDGGVELQPSSYSAVSEHDMEIFHSASVKDRKSEFIGHVARVTSLTEVEQFREQVLRDKKVARATHNIMAYRFTDKSTGICHHDCDDDGETAAAGRIGEMLRLMGLGEAASESGVAVIVTRWYGGVHLGPDRFKLITNSARKALEVAGLATKGSANSRKSSKT
jgi:putative IMPACT (imprinted ancient) family translation regulator